MKQKPEIYAYVLMRNDLASLGAGKSAAHSHHAGTRMSYWIRKSGNRAQKALFHSWEDECEGAGTCIVLECDEETMKVVVAQIQELRDQGCSAGVWRDPTYPSTTARGFCLIDVSVAGWALGPKDLLRPILGDLPLMNNAEWKRDSAD